MAKEKQEKKQKKKEQTNKYKVKNRLIYKGKVYEVGQEIELTPEEAVRLYSLLEVNDVNDIIVKK